MKQIILILILISSLNLFSQEISFYPTNSETVSDNFAIDSPLSGRGKAEKGKTLIGITLGGSMATNLYNYGELGGEPPMGFLSAPAAGLTFDFESRGSFSLLMGLYLKLKGDKIHMQELVKTWKLPQEQGNTLTTDATGYISTSAYWAELPLVLSLNLGRPKRIQIGAGPFVGYALNGTEIKEFSIDYFLENELIAEEKISEKNELLLVHLVEDSEADANLKQMNRIDFGIYGLIGYKTPKFSFALSASYGLSNLRPISGDDIFSATKSEKKTTSLTPSLSITWFFKH
jgi:hypothetical protein